MNQTSIVFSIFWHSQRLRASYQKANPSSSEKKMSDNTDLATMLTAAGGVTLGFLLLTEDSKKDDNNEMKGWIAAGTALAGALAAMNLLSNKPPKKMGASSNYAQNPLSFQNNDTNS